MFNRPPTFRRHKPTNQAFCAVPTERGARKYVYFGEWGSAKATASYTKFLAERKVAAVPDQVLPGPVANPTVAELLAAFLRHARQYYRRADGTATNEVNEYTVTIRIVRGLYGYTPAKDINSLSLKTIRRAMIDGDKVTGRRPWSRKLVNQRIGRVKRMWKWAAEEMLIPTACYLDLTTVKGLEAGRSAARETDPIKPVSDADIDGTLPFLSRHVRGMVEFQRHAGCRPGEVCSLRKCDVDQSGPIWHYRPPHHKLAHRGKTRVIAIGPKAQAVLAEFPTEDPEDYVFSPQLCVEESRATRSAERVTPRYPSHVERNRTKRMTNPKRSAGVKYQTKAYGHAIRTAVEKANTAGVKVRHWHPNQLRHTFATRVRQEYGLEAAQVALGHARADVTQVYAERNMQLAAEVAKEVG